MKTNVAGKAKGGLARAKKLTAKQRSEIAKKAAIARWRHDYVEATHEGKFKVDDSTAEISCANLVDGKRVITQATFLTMLGSSRSPKAGTGAFSDADKLPFFLQEKALKPFINGDLSESTRPIFFKTKHKKQDVGYDATLLPKVANVYLKFRDYHLKENGKVPKQFEHIVLAADILMRGLAHAGIISLVDQATGFQKDRARDELAMILEAFVAQEIQPWVKTFPSTFYEQMFRLKGLPFPSDIVRKPQQFGHLTNDITYNRLAPGVLEKLKEKNERNKKKKENSRLRQKLTPDFGHPKLRDLVTSVTTIMILSKGWKDFKLKLDKVHPAYH